jgi:hypothetical protein
MPIWECFTDGFALWKRVKRGLAATAVPNR